MNEELIKFMNEKLKQQLEENRKNGGFDDPYINLPGLFDDDDKVWRNYNRKIGLTKT